MAIPSRLVGLSDDGDDEESFAEQRAQRRNREFGCPEKNDPHYDSALAGETSFT